MKRWMALLAFGGWFAACDDRQDFGLPSSSSNADASVSDASPSTPATSDEGGGFDASPPLEEAVWTWMNPVPHNYATRAIWGSAENDIWVVGAEGMIAHWNGQRIGVARQLEAAPTLYGIWGSAHDDVWVVGRGFDTGVAVHWDGHSWSSGYSLAEQSVHSLWGSSRDNIWALAGSNVACRWNGTNWKCIQSSRGTDSLNDERTLRDLWGAAANDIWAVGDQGVFAHFDGTVWNRNKNEAAAPEAAQSTNQYVGIWGSAANDIWAVFADATSTGFSHWDGASWKVLQREAAPTQAQARGSTPRQLGHAVWGSARDNIVARVGDRIWHFNGARWIAAKNPNANAFWAAPGGVIHSASGGGQVFRYDPAREGTASWSELAPRLRYDIQRGSIGRDQSMFAVSTSWPGLMEWKEERWIAHDATNIGPFASVSALDANDVWAAGFMRLPPSDSGLVAHWDGHSWTVPPFPIPAKNFSDVWARTSNDIWVIGGGAGAGDFVARYDGSTWRSIFAKVEALWRVIGTSERDVWILADKAVYHFDGDGVQESLRLSAQGESFNDILVLGTHDVWAASNTSLRHWDGDHWSVVPNTGDYPISSMWGSGANGLWLASQVPTGSYVRYWNGTEITKEVRFKTLIRDLFGFGDDVWAVGDNGATLRYTAGSTTTPH